MLPLPPPLQRQSLGRWWWCSARPLLSFSSGWVHEPSASGFPSGLSAAQPAHAQTHPFRGHLSFSGLFPPADSKPWGCAARNKELLLPSLRQAGVKQAGLKPNQTKPLQAAPSPRPLARGTELPRTPQLTPGHHGGSSQVLFAPSLLAAGRRGSRRRDVCRHTVPRSGSSPCLRCSWVCSRLWPCRRCHQPPGAAQEQPSWAPRGLPRRGDPNQTYPNRMPDPAPRSSHGKPSPSPALGRGAAPHHWAKCPPPPSTAATSLLGQGVTADRTLHQPGVGSLAMPAPGGALGPWAGEAGGSGGEGGVFCAGSS